jgi:hypothetical protein
MLAKERSLRGSALVPHRLRGPRRAAHLRRASVYDAGAGVYLEGRVFGKPGQELLTAEIVRRAEFAEIIQRLWMVVSGW